MADKLAFINQYRGSADYASSKTGIPADFILGQWGLETGWGSSFAGAFNLGNIQGNSPTPYAYNNLQEGVDAYVNTLNNSRYTGARLANSPEQFGAYLAMGGYAADASYGSKIADTIKSIQNMNNDSGSSSWLPGGLSGFTLDPMEWLKNRGLSTLFFVGGIAGLAFLAWKYAPSGGTNGE